ncbi:type III toxin-antitoxin system ToxN/AbiQ family toxin [uncultured Dubosiella sp.]|uniref:type III toxin-antitoxin system ToxN/AbiQ family toxin n=1 Tax=uncultured Dubosiella sp. TaxID=1937011 RepID=UPI0025B3EC82|nr:type III toxin-antitoxin system ToxN/AbiQ family toxin [uncultured Dubosiella sp.]
MKKIFRFLENYPKIYRVDYPYRLYLHRYDSRVSMKSSRPFYGVLIAVDDIHYLIPLTSKPKRDGGKTRNKRTTVEIFDEHDNAIAALLINNMIPVPPTFYEKFDFNLSQNQNSFQKEKIYLRRKSVQDEILRKAENVYRVIVFNQDPFLKRFCCDFKTLEQVSNTYRICEPSFVYVTGVRPISSPLPPTMWLVRDDSPLSNSLFFGSAEISRSFSHKSQTMNLDSQKNTF